MTTKPDIRTLPNGKTIHFYSPQQIEAIIPPEDRLPKQRSDNLPVKTPLFNSSHIQRQAPE